MPSKLRTKPTKVSVDLAAYPDLVVVYLGFRISTWRALRTLAAISRGLSALRSDPPEGLLRDEPVFYALNHIGMRQYWRDLDSLERFTRSGSHAEWWRRYGKDPAGAGFWHEAYRRSGGMEALYIGLPEPIGLGAFAAAKAADGAFLTSRGRLAA